MAEKIRSRLWCVLLYPEDETHVAALELIRQCFNYVGILHDKDAWTEEDEQQNPDHKAGELKKPHYHIILKFTQARWNTALADDLGIACNYLERCRSFDSAAVYLVHDGLSDKYQYDSEALEGPLVSAVMKLLAPADENGRVLELLKLIDSMGYITRRHLVQVACENDFYADLRRMGYLLSHIIEEHNEEWMRAFDDRPQSEDTWGFNNFENNGGNGTSRIPQF